ncbi:MULTISPECIES: zinc ribbon domain-containing protein [Enterobacteriaceae]|uniref:zinc ribbon domain-containing protein n=1 Tax=Enterobacteriaceae TaxID=543 RepID=UPI00255052EF|nr:zinc ribbon domain-containing protein [Leclercia adecarboxylata]MDK4743961.1 zinc ribbon domain-containing protein [Leclercia adecarboxylata]
MPSTKLCGGCVYTLPKLVLNVRSWNCQECAETHDRDVNAAKNNKAAELAVLVH